MPRISEILEALEIVKEVQPELLDKWPAAEHDQIWLFDVEKIPEDSEVGKKLAALGFFVSEDSWSCHI